MNSIKEKQELARRVRRLVNAIKKNPKARMPDIANLIGERKHYWGNDTTIGGLKVFSTTLFEYFNGPIVSHIQRLEVAKELTKNYL